MTFGGFLVGVGLYLGNIDHNVDTLQDRVTEAEMERLIPTQYPNPT